MLKFLGDVNLFRGHFHAVHAPGQKAENPAADENRVYVRPHEIEVVDEPAADTLAVEFSQALTVGPRTRLELRRPDDGSFIDVEMPREAWLQLQQRQGIERGRLLHLRARQETRFEAGADWSNAHPQPMDPAAMI